MELMKERWKAMNMISTGTVMMRGVGHHLAPGHVELLEVVDADHGRAQLLALHHHQRPQVLVPGGQEGEDRHGGDRRSGQRHHDAAVDPEPARPVDGGRLVQLLRDGVEVLVEEEDRERVGDEGHDLDLVGVQPALGEAVDEVEVRQLVDPPQQRQRHRLERHDQGGQDDAQDDLLSAELDPGQGERGHRVDDQAERHGADGDDDRVEQELGERHPVEDAEVVGQGQVADRQERPDRGQVGEDLDVGFEAGDDHEQQRQPEDQASRIRRISQQHVRTVCLRSAGLVHGRWAAASAT